MDCFARLELRRQLWIDPETLKQNFLRLSAERHPDKAQGAEQKREAEKEFAALNEACNTLRNTRLRLQHFLELEGVPKAPHVQSVPPAALEFFSRVAEITKRADELAREKRAAASPMIKVQALTKALACAETVRALQAELAGQIRKTEAELQSLATSGQVQPPLSPATVNTLQSAVATLGFLERWNAQLQEKIAALTF
ncbi:MAG TPA: DnaJ domain-containing protein [Verrucomicrobiae bacterium]|jgi:DnaJ-domain-containing protein 1|nr:DnaJ domain-containing protein [Verrucomicrobiae bacterium]